MKHRRLYRHFPFSVVLYDHSCVICRQEMQRLKKFDKKERLHLVDISDAKFSDEFWGFSQKTLNQVLHVRCSDGQWFTGMDAVRHVYQQVGLGWLWLPSQVPGLVGMSNLLYRLFARYRYAISRLYLVIAGKPSHPECRDNICMSKLR